MPPADTSANARLEAPNDASREAPNEVTREAPNEAPRDAPYEAPGDTRPAAEVASPRPAAIAVSALWNPDAAVAWSLLFSPVFGAYVHMHNWHSLGEPQQAARAWRWFRAGVALLALQALSGALNTRLNDESLLMHPASVLFTLLWYLLAARPQSLLIKARYGRTYPRRRWDPVVLAALIGAGLYSALKAITAWLLIALT
jgi:hypothetical protein